MSSILKINKNISKVVIPYKDIFTTVYAVKTSEGVLLFDAASYDEDVENYILPMLDASGIAHKEIKAIFISHNHKDHSGALCKLLEFFPEATVFSRSQELLKKFTGYTVCAPEDMEILLKDLKVITIPGHTKDSCAVLDTRTKTLISGDSLQLFGIVGSGKWGANINFPEEHLKAIDKLRKMDIEHILTAHDYQPYGHSYSGKTAVSKALDACVLPLHKIKELLLKYPNLDDEEICKLYNSFGGPTLGSHVVTAVRGLNDEM